MVPRAVQAITADSEEGDEAAGRMGEQYLGSNGRVRYIMTWVVAGNAYRAFFRMESVNTLGRCWNQERYVCV